MTRTTWALGISISIMVLGLTLGPFIPMTVPYAFADSFNVKPGAWEMTLTTITTGSLVPPDVLERMPPERRDKFEKAMQARSGQPKTRVSQKCVTQKDLDQNRLIKEESEADEPRCTTKIASKSSSKLVMERSCSEPHSSTSQITVEAKTPESVVASVDRALEGAGKIHIDIKGRWLGTSCAEIKDRD